jgi:hypothetical protein
LLSRNHFVMMQPMIIEALLALVHYQEGTPYIRGGHGPGGTDCSGLVSELANIASGRDPYVTRFSTANEAAELSARGFFLGTAPNALVVGWNSHHTAATLPDGTPVESGGSLGGGVRIGGQGAYQAQFTQHAYLPMPPETPQLLPPVLADYFPPPMEVPGP